MAISSSAADREVTKAYMTACLIDALQPEESPFVGAVRSGAPFTPVEGVWRPSLRRRVELRIMAGREWVALKIAPWLTDEPW